MIHLIGFDLDDTLYNATSLAFQARIGGLKKIQEYGLKFDLHKATVALLDIVEKFGSNYSKHYNELLITMKNNPENFSLSEGTFSISKYVAAGVMGYHEIKIRKLKAYADVKPVLKKLKKQKYVLILISDGLAVKQYEKLIRMGILEYFNAVFISEEVGWEKPQKEFYYYCLEKIGVKPSESIYVGDRLDKDIIPAKQIGMKTVLIHRGGKYDPKKIADSLNQNPINADYEINDLYELFSYI